MPIVTLCTNLSGELAATINTPNFRTEFINLLADTLQKPAGGVALIVYSGSELCQLGVDAQKPVVILTVSRGNLPIKFQNVFSIFDFIIFVLIRIRVDPRPRKSEIPQPSLPVLPIPLPSKIFSAKIPPRRGQP